MAKDWAKIYRDVSRSRRMATLIRTNAFAEALFWRIKAWADDYGHYLADPELVAHEVGGVAKLSAKRVAKALDDMEAAGVIRRYEIESKLYLEIADYHQHQEPNWMRMSGPEYPLPLDWRAPAELVAFILEKSGLRNVTLERYGITRENCPAALHHLLNSSSAPVEQGVEQGVEHVVGIVGVQVNDSEVVQIEQGVEQEGNSVCNTPSTSTSTSEDVKPLRPLTAVDAVDKAPLDDLPMRLMNRAEVRSALLQAAHDWTSGQIGKFAGAILEAVGVQSYRKQLGALTEAEALRIVLGEFQRDPPSPTTFPDKWLDSLCQQRASPGQQRSQRLQTAAQQAAREFDERERHRQEKQGVGGGS